MEYIANTYPDLADRITGLKRELDAETNLRRELQRRVDDLERALQRADTRNAALANRVANMELLGCRHNKINRGPQG